MRKMMFGVLAAVALAGGISTAQAGPAPSLEGIAAATPTAYAQWRRGYWGRPYWRRGYYWGPGWGYGAAVTGLAAGALVGGAIANSAVRPPPPPATVDPNLAAWCARRYGRAFDPVTGTFAAPSGERIVCTP